MSCKKPPSEAPPRAHYSSRPLKVLGPLPRWRCLHHISLNNNPPPGLAQHHWTPKPPLLLLLLGSSGSSSSSITHQGIPNRIIHYPSRPPRPPLPPRINDTITRLDDDITRLDLLMVPPPTVSLAADQVFFTRLDCRLVQVVQLPFGCGWAPFDLHSHAARLEPRDG